MLAERFVGLHTKNITGRNQLVKKCFSNSSCWTEPTPVKTVTKLFKMWIALNYIWKHFMKRRKLGKYLSIILVKLQGGDWYSSDNLVIIFSFRFSITCFISSYCIYLDQLINLYSTANTRLTIISPTNIAVWISFHCIPEVLLKWSL